MITATLRTVRGARNEEETVRTIRPCPDCDATGYNRKSADASDRETSLCERCVGTGWVFADTGKRITPSPGDGKQCFDPERNEIVEARHSRERTYDRARTPLQEKGAAMIARQRTDLLGRRY
jgi:hypothetical protein